MLQKEKSYLVTGFLLGNIMLINSTKVLVLYWVKIRILKDNK